jgi:hypothetical protein
VFGEAPEFLLVLQADVYFLPFAFVADRVVSAALWHNYPRLQTASKRAKLSSFSSC